MAIFQILVSDTSEKIVTVAVVEVVVSVFLESQEVSQSMSVEAVSSMKYCRPFKRICSPWLFTLTQTDRKLHLGSGCRRLRLTVLGNEQHQVVLWR